MARPQNPDRGKVEIAAEPDRIRRWVAAAMADELTLSQWIRRALDAAAKRQSPHDHPPPRE